MYGSLGYSFGEFVEDFVEPVRICFIVLVIVVSAQVLCGRRLAAGHGWDLGERRRIAPRKLRSCDVFGVENSTASRRGHRGRDIGRKSNRWDLFGVKLVRCRTRLHRCPGLALTLAGAGSIQVVDHQQCIERTNGAVRGDIVPNHRIVAGRRADTGECEWHSGIEIIDDQKARRKA